MKWTVLSDNRAKDPSFETEHGLSILLETARYRILLDTGASDVLIRNAKQMGVDLGTVDYVFVSHGHSDHAGGLRDFMEVNKRAKVIVSPEAVNGKFYSMRNDLHSITTVWPEGIGESSIMADRTCEVADGIHVMAHIPQIHPMPKGNRHLFTKDAEGNYIPDDFRHELALYTDGLLFTGCAHSGLENILAACPWPVDTVLGGFHLLDGHETRNELTDLARRLVDCHPQTVFHTSHCTGDIAYSIMKKAMGDRLHAFFCGTVRETATGMILEEQR
jgi:7,8-dihydropterin-6-yl-methyl-4-(beta-D-ribofuranosyl)aminobenzene 5'-phosphate synthase